MGKRWCKLRAQHWGIWTCIVAILVVDGCRMVEVVKGKHRCEMREGEEIKGKEGHVPSETEVLDKES